MDILLGRARAGLTAGGPLPGVAGIAGVAALALCIAAGGLAGLVMGLVVVGVVLGCARTFAAPIDRTALVRAATAIVLARVATTAILHLWLSQGGTSGAMFLDDQGYPTHAARLAKWWLGEAVTDPSDPMDPVPGLSYIRFAAFLFTIYGPNALVLKLANTALSMLAGLLIYRAAASAALPNARWVAYLTWIFPSLVLWGALTLKESFVIFLMGVALLCVSEQIRTRSLLWWIPFVLALLVLYSTRSYLFVLLVVAWPIALAIGGNGWRRTALAVPVSVALLAGAPAATYFTPDFLATPTRVRVAMAQGARSAFVTPMPAPTPITRASELVDVVLPSVQVSQTSGGAAPSGGVPPGSPAPSPSPSPEIRETMRIASGPTGPLGPSTPIVAATRLQEEQVTASFQHLPIGVLYLIGAPFPGSGTSLLELGTIPEMLLWYATLAFAVLAIVRSPPQRWRPHAYALLVMLGLAGVLSLVEGNVGTLVRHRGMLIPLVATLAAVGLFGFRWPWAGSQEESRPVH